MKDIAWRWLWHKSWNI